MKLAVFHGEKHLKNSSRKNLWETQKTHGKKVYLGANVFEVHAFRGVLKCL